MSMSLLLVGKGQNDIIDIQILSIQKLIMIVTIHGPIIILLSCVPYPEQKDEDTKKILSKTSKLFLWGKVMT